MVLWIIVIIIAAAIIYLIFSKKVNIPKNDISNVILEDRIIYLKGELNDKTSSEVVEQLLNLEHESVDKEIKLIIHCNGGSLSAGFTIYDTMRYIKCPISTVALHEVVGIGVLILSSGAKGKRFAAKDCKIAITSLESHTDISDENQQHIDSIKRKVFEILSNNTGQEVNTIINDIDNNRLFNAIDAKAYGIIDVVGFN